MVLNKWNYEKREYEPYEVPDDWHTLLYTNDMDELVNCVSCGKKVKFGETYTSREVHSNMGFGYPVCEKCYSEEWSRDGKFI